jgi:phosphoribosylanthranilate isomerase
MLTSVKICGLKTLASLDAALTGGAAYVGFVFYPPSPRNLTPEAAAPLADAARGKAKIVALVVDADDALLQHIVDAIHPDLLQLHGSETVERCRDIRHKFGRPVIKAIKVETAADAEAALAFAPAVDLILFDAKAPKGLAGALPGGNGLSFDWHLLDTVKSRVGFMLSGGLTPDNVAAAIAATGARAVDVSSGVESSPGVKDLTMISKFLAASAAA